MSDIRRGKYWEPDPRREALGNQKRARRQLRNLRLRDREDSGFVASLARWAA